MDHSTEEKWQKLWKRDHIFEPSIDPEKKKFMLTVPWPYTNGSLHVGHGKAYTTGDIVARYRRNRGFNVIYPMGFHQSGTPILAYSEKISMNDPGAIKTYRTYLEQYEKPERIDALMEEFKEPEKIAQYFSNSTMRDFTAMGYSIDWTRRFTSAEETFQDFVQWQFRILKDKGYIKQGKYPILYSLRDENAAGEDDILDGDINKVSIEEFTAIKFRGSKYSLVASSLRPETIFGITNLWINGNADYSVIEYNAERLVVSDDTIEKITRQLEGVKVIGRISAEEILEEEFQVPVTGEKKRVFVSDFVDPDNGTGVVYSVPGHSIYDYVAIREKSLDLEIKELITLKDSKLSVESLASRMNITSTSQKKELNEATQILYKEEYYSGKMMDNCGPVSGKSVVEARDMINAILRESGEAFTFYEVSRKAETRSGSKVIVAVLRDQWFIDYSVPEWKKSAHKLVDRMLFVPDFYRVSMHETVDWLRERPCARRRGIGTKLPFDPQWTIESLSDSTIYPAVYTNVLQLREIREKLGKIPDGVFDYIFLSEGDLEDFDPTLRKIIEEARNQADYWYGVDIRITAMPHFTNHLVFYIMNHAAVLPKALEPGGLGIVGTLVSEGAKIGKSKGNAVNLLTVAKKYSADVYRLYIAILADMTSQLDWNEKDLEALINKYQSFLDMLDGFRKTEGGENQAERWFISRFYQRLQRFIRDMDEYSIRSGYVSIFYEAMNDLRRVEKRGGNQNAAVSAVLKDWLIALSAVMPHTCEEYWHKYIKDSYVSVETFEEDYSERIDSELIEKESYLDSVIEDIRSIISVTGKEPSKIRIQTAHPDSIEFVRMVKQNRIKEVKAELKPLIPEYMKVKKFIQLRDFDEFELINENSEYIGALFSSNVAVSIGDLKGKGKKAWPGRPSIIIEN